MKYPALVFVVIFPLALTTETAPRAETVLAKSVWMEAMKTVIPNSFCQPKQYFRQCFNVTEDQCIEEASRAVKVCMLSMADKLPDELHQPDDGRAWGSKLGSCAGTAYETSLIKNRLGTAECNNVSNWVAPPNSTK